MPVGHKKRYHLVCMAWNSDIKTGPDLEPDGIDNLAEDKQGEDPESAEDGRQDEL